MTTSEDGRDGGDDVTSFREALAQASASPGFDRVVFVTDVDLALERPAGTTPADLTPRPGSPLVDTGLDLLDRNGPVPGRYSGAGPERGAVELP